MSLATRCPACGTIFRVVQDQLKISEGWVRCGRCAEVFNASDALIDLQPTTAAGTEPGAFSALPRARAGIADRAQAAGASGWLREDDDEPARDRLDAAEPDLARSGPSGALPQGSGWLRTPSSPAPFDRLSGDGDAEHGRDVEALARDGAVPVGERGVSLDEAAAPVSASIPGPAEPLAGERAEAAAANPNPASASPSSRAAARPALIAASIALAALLVAQAGWVWRDTLAANQPALRPALDALCSAVACRIEAPRRLDALAVQSSGLVQLDGSTNYRLDVVVRNRAAVAARAPAVDLTLTDAQGRVVSRRVLQGAELGLAGADPAAIAAGAELGLQAVLSTRGVPVAGYTVELFYP